MTNEEEEPLSPMAGIFQSPGIDYCAVTIMGFKTKINPDVVLDALKHNVYKHPRFSSKLSDNGAKWIETEVNVEDHVAVPYIDPKEIGEDGESFVDDYISRLTMIPLYRSRPLWDIHILNVKISDAEGVGVIRSHHLLGDGMSLCSLLLTCTHKTSDPGTSSTAIPPMKRQGAVLHSLRKKGWFLRSIFTIGSTMTLIWNTIVDMLLLLATILFLKDTKTPLKGGVNVMSSPKIFYHQIVSLDDIKLIKKVMNMVAAELFDRPVRNTTICVSNVIGPMEEISFRGHPIAYIAPSSYGHSHALLEHFISYAEKMIISVAVDPTVIPDPHKICDEMEKSMKAMKTVLWERGLLYGA